MTTRSTLVSRTIKAAPQQVYQAFLDAKALAMWLAPDGMRGTVERLEPYQSNGWNPTRVGHSVCP